MNIVKMLNKQKESGKDIVLKDGNIISKDEIAKANLKAYLAGVKDGSIPATTSLDDYSKQVGKDFVTIDDLIDVIEKGFEDCEEPCAAE